MLSQPKYADLTIGKSVSLAEDDATRELLAELDKRVVSIRSEMDRFRTWCDRADQLYYAEEFTDGGADLWPRDPSATTPGRSHVSVNTPPTYVDVPAALQAYEPIENMLASDTTKEARSAASKFERLYSAWKADINFDLKFHKACVVKGLYGRTASRVYYDNDKRKPCVEIVDQPRNLHLGYKTDAYEELEWAAYVQRRDPNAVMEEFGVDVTLKPFGNDPGAPLVPFVSTSVGELMQTQASRSWLQESGTTIEVWDYWYREPAPRKPRRGGGYAPVKMETWNVTICGNEIVNGPNKYPEFDGVIPYVPLFNTFIPGVPNGRADLYDMEQLIRETYEKITNGSQMINSATAGDYWQLVGPDAPTRIPATLKPARNQIVGPGPGNRIETITPFIAQFQLEQFLSRLDRHKAEVSGLNDLLLGLAPAQVLSSSKAINALIANYETRLAMRRLLLYAWRRATWDLAVKVWAKRDARVRTLVAAGGGVLEITDPSLSPRDELETATKALNLVNGKLWSQRRGMDATGVDDPETEQEMIREERTDATLFPADVQVMAQLMAALQAIGLQASQATQNQAQGQLASGQSDLRNAVGAATPNGTNASQGAELQGVIPPEGMVAGAPDANLPFAQAQGGGAQTAQLQGLIQNGQAKGRILTKQSLGGR